MLRGQLTEKRFKSLDDVSSPYEVNEYKEGMKAAYIHDEVCVH